MAKKLTPFSKAILSGGAALILVGGAVASLSLMGQNQDVQGRAYDPFRMITRPTYQPVPSVQCFNRVYVSGSTYYWPDACRGRNVMGMCAQVLTKLTETEIATYNKWVALGKPAIPGCTVQQMTPPPYGTPRSTPVDVKVTPRPTTYPENPKMTARPTYEPAPTTPSRTQPVRPYFPESVQF